MTLTLAARHDGFALARPFRIARGTKTVADVVTVTVTRDGVTGRGEGVPYPRYGESVESVLAAIAAVRPVVEAGATRDALLTLMPAGAARNAVDCALWDLAAREADTSVAAMIGARAPAALASALTIGIATPVEMAAAARAVAFAPVIKVKVDADDPVARVAAVRDAAPDAVLIVDPNESWDRRLLTEVAAALVDARVALLEQPVRADSDAWLEAFEYPVLLCADEAVHVAADLDRVAARYGCINVKLDKAGGLTAALLLAESARARGLALMTGCMISSSLSIAPAMHVAAVSDYVDLDGPLWLEADYPGGVTDARGMLSPPEAGFWGGA